MSRHLTKKERAILWFEAKGKCKICNQDLPNDWHADHIIPYILVQETNIHNMQALCPKCNLRKGSKTMENFVNVGNFRVGQGEAFGTGMERVKNHCQYTAIVLPTRYGKSDVMRVLSVYLWREGLICASLVLSPNNFLRDQMVIDENFNQCLDRYQIDSTGLIKRAVKDGDHLYQPTANGEMFLSLTIQLANTNKQTLSKWIRLIKQRTGLPPLIFIDEAHTGSEDNSWGGTVMAFAEAGALIILMTATPIRSDGKKIPGFDFKEIVTEHTKIWKVRNEINDDYEEERWVDIYSGIRQKITLIPDHETTFAQAWQENVICHLSRQSFEVDLSKYSSGYKGGIKLSELSQTDTKKILGKIIRSREVVDSGTKLMVEWLKIIRSKSLGCGAIVFCGNDTDASKETNRHAKMIRKHIHKYDPSLEVVIATSAIDKDSDKAIDLIKNFVKGVGDVLIVKQMASVGLDSDRLKVALDLSPVRSPASFTQRLMRIATLYGNIQHGIYITPEECIGQALFSELVTNEGGEAVIGDLVFLKSKLLDDDPPPDKSPIYSVNGINPGGASDTRGQEINPSATEIAKGIADDIPGVLDGTTIPGLAKIIANRVDLSKITLREGEQSEVIDTGRLIEELRDDINEKVKEITKARMFAVSRKYDQRLFGELNKALWGELKSVCGISMKVKLETINKIETLRKLKEAAYRMIEENQQ